MIKKHQESDKKSKEKIRSTPQGKKDYNEYQRKLNEKIRLFIFT